MLRGDGFDVIGVSIAGELPLGSIHLELDPGITVLYGRNGSGKSRLLRALGEALGSPVTEEVLETAGWRREVTVRLHPALSADDRVGWINVLADALRLAVEAEAHSRLQTTGDTDAADALTAAPSDIDRMLFSLVDLALWIEDTSLPRDVAADRLVVTSNSNEGLSLRIGASFGRWVDKYDSQVWNAVEIADACAAMLLSIEAPESDTYGPTFLNFLDLMADRLLDDRARRDIREGRSASQWYGPDWAGIPIGAKGRLAMSPALRLGTEHDMDALKRRTLHALQREDDVVAAVLDGEVVLTDYAAAACSRLEGTSNTILSEVLRDAPRLRLLVGCPDEWLAGTAPRWEGHDHASDTWVPLDCLSSAEQRWSALAVDIAIAMEDGPDRPIVILLDEPERGLHRAAELHMVEGLKKLSTSLAGAAIIVATHSPAFLADPTMKRVHVRRSGSGLATTSELPIELAVSPERDLAMEQLGLTRNDLLQLARVFVVVEGAHDEAVLREIAEDDLRDAQAAIIRMHGARNVPAILDSQVLLDMSNAHLLVVVDNVGAADLEPVWTRTVASFAGGDFKSTRRAIRELRDFGSAESGWLADLAQRCFDSGRFDRVSLFSLGAIDIIAYLDPSSFGLDQTWDEILAEYRKSMHRVPLKDWLRENKKASTSVQKVAAGARRLDATKLPDDLENLVARIRQLGYTQTH